MSTDTLSTYGIYRTPTGFAVVRWDTVQGTGTTTQGISTQYFKNLTEARNSLPPHLVPFERSADDDNNLIETWL